MNLKFYIYTMGNSRWKNDNANKCNDQTHFWFAYAAWGSVKPHDATAVEFNSAISHTVLSFQSLLCIHTFTHTYIGKRDLHNTRTKRLVNVWIYCNGEHNAAWPVTNITNVLFFTRKAQPTGKHHKLFQDFNFSTILLSLELTFSWSLTRNIWIFPHSFTNVYYNY